MPVRLDVETQRLVSRRLYQGLKPPAIAEEARVSLSSVYNIKTNLARWGTPHSQRTPRPRGAPNKMTEGAMDDLLRWLGTSQPEAYQREMCCFLEKEYGIKIERSTVSRWLKQRQWSKKKGFPRRRKNTESSPNTGPGQPVRIGELDSSTSSAAEKDNI